MTRLRVDSANAGRVVPIESLLVHVVSRLADVVEGADGALYFCTSNKGASGPASIDDRLARIVAVPPK
jgi:glucose/arabinose dehydrogenase